MTVAHKNLTGTDLHEPKGVAAATANKVYVSDGAASGTWQQITKDQLTGSGNPFGGQLMHVQEVGTAGVASFPGGVMIRNLNTTVTNEIAGASLSSQQVTLPAGTYHIKASAVSYFTDSHVYLRLRNVTAGGTFLLGMPNFTTNAGFPSSGLVSIHSTFEQRVTYLVTTVIQLEHVSSAGAGSGGASIGFNIPYANLMIWKVA